MSARRADRRPTARDVAATTPAHRNRYVDALRAGSICVVVLGHWTVGAVTVTDEGFAGVSLLTLAPWTHPVTWLFQVMPVFFLVGGYANAASLRTHRAGGGTTIAWVRRRALRLLRPTAAFLAVLLTARFIALPLGVDEDLVRTLTWTASTPLWFLVVYLGVVVLAPLADAAHRRWGLRSLLVLVLVVVVGDALRLASGDVAPAAANYLFAWLAVHQAGIAWHDGALPRTSRAAWTLVGAGLGVAILLTGPGPYGVAMVGAATAPDLTNTAPPTIALLALATAQTGLVLLGQRPTARLLERPRPWTAVVLLNSVILTVFLWHMTAFVIASLALYGTGLLPQPPIGSGSWFALRIPWLATLTVILVGLVMLMRTWERPRPSDSAERPSPLGVSLGIGAVLAGMVSLGVSDTTGLAPQIGAIPVVELGLVALGMVLLTRGGGRQDPRGAGPP